MLSALYRRMVRRAAPPDDWPAAQVAAVSHNFLAILASHLLMKVGDLVANPKTTLSWALASVGGPPAFVGLLVPVRESGALIPQFLFTRVVRAATRARGLWVRAALVQGMAVMGCGLTTLLLSGATAGWAMLACVGIFALARALGSISTSEVVARTIPAGERGQLSGLASAGAGVLGLVAGLAGLWFAGPRAREGTSSASAIPDAMAQVGALTNATNLGWLLLMTGALWWGAALVYSRVNEPATPPAAGPDEFGLATIVASLADPGFRHFVITRTLLIATALIPPWLTVVAQRSGAGDFSLLAAFVLADGSAAMLAAPLWGRLADRDSRAVMRLGGLISGLTGLCAAQLMTSAGAGGGEFTRWVWPLLFFVLGVAHVGVRVGRSTYLIDFAPPARRADFVAVANTLIGVALLAIGALGFLSGWLGIAGVVALLSLLALTGAAIGGGMTAVVHR